MPTPFTDAEVAEIRAGTPGCAGDIVHLNHCGSSLPPQVVLDTQIAHLRREAAIGGYEAAEEARDREAAVYDSIASMLGARNHEVARMEHATAAWNAAFWSVPMRRGQRIITHDHDYGANWIAFLRAVEVYGVAIHRVPSDAHGQIDLDLLARALGRPEEVALVSLAWIPTSGGLVNPAVAVGSLTRAAGVPFLLDACQAVGQLDIDVGTIGCDFLTATGRKFLRGPRGTGFLFARDDVLDRVAPAQPDHHGADWVALDRYEYAVGARRFEYWEYDHAAWLGLGAAVDVAAGLGFDRIRATIEQRAEELRLGLSQIAMDVHDQGVERCGIVTATHRSAAAVEVAEELSTRGINVSTTFAGSARADMEARGLPPMVRMSVHCTTTGEEIERTLDALRSILTSPARRSTGTIGQDVGMTRIALLRGINVGGHRTVPMADLRAALVAVGFDSVQTYIQSGNVVFKGGPAADTKTEALIADVMVDRFGLDDVAVIVLSPERLQRARVVSGQAFPPEDEDNGDHAKRVHVVFLATPPAPTRRASLHPDEFAPDRFILDIHDGTAELHVAYADGAGTSKLTTDRIERGLGVRGTARNLNTIDRLLALASS